MAETFAETQKVIKETLLLGERDCAAHSAEALGREARDERKYILAHCVRERRDAVGVRPPAAGTPAARSERVSRDAVPPLRGAPRRRVAATAAASGAFVHAPFVELKDARGADASIPHLQSDHLSVFLYQTVVPVAGVDVKLVLP